MFDSSFKINEAKRLFCVQIIKKLYRMHLDVFTHV